MQPLGEHRVLEPRLEEAGSLGALSGREYGEASEIAAVGRQLDDFGGGDRTTHVGLDHIDQGHA